MERLSIFVHRASDCLTDYESHGDGLITYSLLNGLAKRNHKIFAYATHAFIHEKRPNLNLIIREKHIAPFGSLINWEHWVRANGKFKLLNKKHDFNLVWRMYPYGRSCPMIPETLGKPLVVGPLPYSWPFSKDILAKPRFSIGLAALLAPFEEQGWFHTLKTASLIICLTKHFAIEMQKRFPISKVIYLPPPIDPPFNRSNIIRKSPNLLRPLRLMFVANFFPYKNPLMFCEIVKLLLEQNIRVQATMIGSGPESAEIKKYCIEHRLENTVALTGKIPHRDVYSRLLEADILISTSLGEPYGLNIAEAMSVGTPCICHNSGGPAEIIEDRKDGLLVTELNAQSFADVVTSIYADEELWNTLSKNAISKARQWSSERILPELENWLYKICEKDPPVS